MSETIYWKVLPYNTLFGSQGMKGKGWKELEGKKELKGMLLYFTFSCLVHVVNLSYISI
jgi:hypothetical protein